MVQVFCILRGTDRVKDAGHMIQLIFRVTLTFGEGEYFHQI